MCSCHNESDMKVINALKKALNMKDSEIDRLNKLVFKMKAQIYDL